MSARDLVALLKCWESRVRVLQSQPHGAVFRAWRAVGRPPCVLGFGLALTSAAPVAHATSFRVLHEFDGVHGATPDSVLAFDDKGLLYGSTSSGGAHNAGTLFRLNGTQFSTLFNFNGRNGNSPEGRLLFAPDGNFYGTTLSGGVYGAGTVFSYRVGVGLRVLKSLAGGAGGDEAAGGIARDAAGNLYGVTAYGGDMTCETEGCGTVFKLTPNRHGTGYRFSQLHVFENSDGYLPFGTLVLARGQIYGGTLYDGPRGTGDGAPFSLNTDGTGFTDINPGGNAEVFESGLTPDMSGNLWGVSELCYDCYGSVFKIDAGNTLTTYYNFSGPDGAYPIGTLVLGPNGVFYGTTMNGGTSANCSLGCGTVFSFDPATNAVATLHSFSQTDGNDPFSGLVVDGSGNLYGVTEKGGTNDDGVLFEVTP